MLGAFKSLIEAGMDVDLVSAWKDARSHLHIDRTITHVLCETKFEGGSAEEAYSFLQSLRHPAFFCVLGPPTMGWMSLGIPTVPKPISAPQVLRAFQSLEEAQDTAA